MLLKGCLLCVQDVQAADDDEEMNEDGNAGQQDPQQVCSFALNIQV